ncbi:class I SAM-dependent methyltransferase [Ilumatobacter sp.]|uniref:class I SAM-dependent methyltransferase n=1 Tax=Ilumatobacter sp. TaxID=1967498 RepID=UPI003B5209FD
MQGFDSTTYGEAFADVYDDWYAEVTDVDATVRRVVATAGDGARLLELGVGTGRLALPLARAGLEVVGVDSSRAMLDRLAERDPDRSVGIVHGDMVDDLPAGPFDACLVAYNTILNLLDPDEQRRCFREVAARLVPSGRFVVEAVVPDERAPAGASVGVRSMTADRVVLSVSRHHPDERRSDGQFVELTESGGVRLRPWAIRWTTPGELDEMADDAGFDLDERVADMAGAAYDDASDQHVSTYRLR